MDSCGLPSTKLSIHLSSYVVTAVSTAAFTALKSPVIIAIYLPGHTVCALGILETYDAASIIEAADQAAKTAIVDLIELRIAKGMCGKSYMMITGEVSAVEASIDRAKELVAAKGMYLDSSVIAHPDRRMIDSIL